jgi:hypothetical protein
MHLGFADHLPRCPIISMIFRCSKGGPTQVSQSPGVVIFPDRRHRIYSPRLNRTVYWTWRVEATRTQVDVFLVYAPSGVATFVAYV